MGVAQGGIDDCNISHRMSVCWKPQARLDDRACDIGAYVFFRDASAFSRNE
jgi:hypothetical protein